MAGILPALYFSWSYSGTANGLVFEQDPLRGPRKAGLSYELVSVEAGRKDELEHQDCCYRRYHSTCVGSQRIRSIISFNC